jgi:hypothetical protein
MRFRSMIVLVGLCLLLGASSAPAAEAPSAPAIREAGWMAHILGHLEVFLKAAWDNEAGIIDPLGGNSPNSGAPAGDGTTTSSTDEAGIIDPWGGSGR